MTRETIPCMWCGEPTRMHGTKKCDRCWELSSRIESDPDLARRMLSSFDKATTPATPGTVAFGLGEIAAHIRRWLEWQRQNRASEGLETPPETAIMALPVPTWPNHRQFEAWIATIEAAAAALAVPATPAEDLILAGLSVLIRTQYLPGKYDSPEVKEHSAKLMDDIFEWTSAYARHATAPATPEADDDRLHTAVATLADIAERVTSILSLDKYEEEARSLTTAIAEVRAALPEASQ